MFTKQTILDAIGGKPSGALQLMLDGLLDDKRPFRINMGTFGVDQGNGACFGCAATCAAYKLLGKKFKVDTLQRRRKFKTDDNITRDALYLFEDAIDSARLGMMQPLFRFCNPKWDSSGFDHQIFLTTSSWREEIPQIEKLIEELKQEGY